MNNPKLWVLILALVSFAGGVAGGTWFTAHLYREAPTPGVFAEYEQNLARAFELSPERTRLLHVVLANYQKEIDEIKDRHMADFMTAMEPELSSRGRYYRDLIQGRVLPDSQRSRFDLLMQGAPWPPTE